MPALESGVVQPGCYCVDSNLGFVRSPVSRCARDVCNMRFDIIFSSEVEILTAQTCDVATSRCCSILTLLDGYYDSETYLWDEPVDGLTALGNISCLCQDYANMARQFTSLIGLDVSVLLQQCNAYTIVNNKGATVPFWKRMRGYNGNFPCPGTLMDPTHAHATYRWRRSIRAE
eukprot:3814763-Pyramimonas_sp.AAC.1